MTDPHGLVCYVFSAATPIRFGCFSPMWRLYCQALATDGCLNSVHSMRIDTRTLGRCSLQIFIVCLSPACPGRGLSSHRYAFFQTFLSQSVKEQCHCCGMGNRTPVFMPPGSPARRNFTTCCILFKRLNHFCLPDKVIKVLLLVPYHLPDFRVTDPRVGSEIFEKIGAYPEVRLRLLVCKKQLLNLCNLSFHWFVLLVIATPPLREAIVSEISFSRLSLDAMERTTLCSITDDGQKTVSPGFIDDSVAITSTDITR